MRNLDRMQLQRRRTEAGLSCQALSAAAGLTPSHVALIENGQRNPRPATLKAIVAVDGRISFSEDLEDWASGRVR